VVDVGGYEPWFGGSPEGERRSLWKKGEKALHVENLDRLKEGVFFL